MSHENTNWGQSVAGVVIRDGKVLLARHTYGLGNGMLIIPGGYVDFGETPQNALKREFLEETGITVEPRAIVGIRFNMHDWYVVFRADYVSGEACSDGEENSEVLWVDVAEAMEREDVPVLTKALLSAALDPDKALTPHPYEGNPKHAPSSLFCP
ncbi:MAG: NUDIX hydrolase [Clostridia bacterium]|nr:NUDIX hydrolase [Clostridia bacterium]